MNTPNPLIPQGSLQTTKSKSNIRIVVFGIVAIHAVFFVGLLMQGCKPDETKTDTRQTQAPPRPTLPTLPPLTETNPPASPITNMPVTPTPPPIADVAPTATVKEYTIVKGDYFEKIAKANGLTSAAIEKANPGVDSKKLKVGQKIQIPAPTPKVGATAAVPDAAPTEAGAVYAVKSGDTLTKIAAGNGTTVKALRAANDLKTDRLKVGQKLKLPGKTVVPAAAPEAAAVPTVPTVTPKP